MSFAWRHSHISLAFIRELQTLFSLSVVVTLLTAIELSIQWNGISSSVNQVSTAAQLIPLLTAIAVILIGILHSLTATDDYGGGSSASGYGSSHSGSSGGSRSEKTSSGSSGGSGPVPRHDGEVVVDWGRNTGQPFIPPPPVQPGGFPVPPPPGPAQPIPVYPPGVRTVTVEPPEAASTSRASSSRGNNHTERSSKEESGESEQGNSSSGEENQDEDTDNNYTSNPASPPPRQKFPPPKWPPGWGQNESQRHTQAPPLGGFPPPPMPAFMTPFPGAVRPPPF